MITKKELKKDINKIIDKFNKNVDIANDYKDKINYKFEALMNYLDVHFEEKKEINTRVLYSIAGPVNEDYIKTTIVVVPNKKKK